MDETAMLTKFWVIIQAAKHQIKELQPDLDFTLDLSIQALDINHPLAIQARDLDWKPQHHNDSAWYEKSDEYGQVSIFIE